MAAIAHNSYPTSRAQASNTSAPQSFPFSDPRNVIASGPQHRFSLGEGTYNLRDEILLGDVQPHPSERALPVNLLDTKPSPLTSGTRLSLAVLAPRRPTSFKRRNTNYTNFRSVFSSSANDSSQNSSHSGSDYGSSRNDGHGMAIPKSRFGENNPALAPSNAKEPKDPLKRRKPKGSLTKGNSSFISRGTPHENLSKRLQEHQTDGLYALANISRAIYWMDLSSTNKQEQLMKIILAKAHALCHDFNEVTKTAAHLDYIVGCNTADILWFEPISQKYAHLNKNGIVHSSPITQIRWLPGSENLFLAAHLDGSLTIQDKEKDDAAFTPEENPIAAKVSSDGKRLPRLRVKKSVNSKNQKHNPIAFWKATNQRINDLAFSPDGKLLALACEDGTLRIIDYCAEELIALYRAYYGGFTCVAWSPDGEYLLTGGQDDLISLWSLDERTLVARGAGHTSWLSSVAFDPWRCDETTYRFGSVGEDGRLLLWDFSVGMLNQPRAASIRQSVSSFAQGAERSGSVATMTQDTFSSPVTVHADGHSSAGTSNDGEEDEISHPVLPRAAVAMLPPIVSKRISERHALSWLRFEEDCIIASSKGGNVYTFDRPTEQGQAAAGETGTAETDHAKR